VRPHLVLLIACAAVTYAACEWFVNAVARRGHRLRAGSLAAGTIVAVSGTALPERRDLRCRRIRRQHQPEGHQGCHWKRDHAGMAGLVTRTLRV